MHTLRAHCVQSIVREPIVCFGKGRAHARFDINCTVVHISKANASVVTTCSIGINRPSGLIRLENCYVCSWVKSKKCQIDFWNVRAQLCGDNRVISRNHRNFGRSIEKQNTSHLRLAWNLCVTVSFHQSHVLNLAWPLLRALVSINVWVERICFEINRLKWSTIPIWTVCVCVYLTSIRHWKMQWPNFDSFSQTNGKNVLLFTRTARHVLCFFCRAINRNE